MITPLEIRKKEFEKAFRGYEKEEVDAFLLSLSQAWERLLEENKEYKRKFETAEKEGIRLKEVENSLFKTLKNAEDTGSSIVDQAKKNAELHIREAQMNAEAILNEARTKSRSIFEEADQKAREIVEGLHDEVKNLEREYHYLQNQKNDLLQDLKNLLNDTLEKVSRYSSKGTNTELENKFKELKKTTFEKPSKTAGISSKEFVKESEVAVKKEIKTEPLFVKENTVKENTSIKESTPIVNTPVVSTPVSDAFRTEPAFKDNAIKIEKPVEKEILKENKIANKESAETGGSFFDNI